MDGLDIKQTVNLVDYAQKNKSVRRTLIWMNEEKDRKRERNRQTKETDIQTDTCTCGTDIQIVVHRQTGRQAYRQIHIHVGQTNRQTHVQYRQVDRQTYMYSTVLVWAI